MSLTTIHYDRPISHSQRQTVWRIAPNNKVYSPSIKILDLILKPNKASYWPVLVGAYACVKSVQIRLDGRDADFWNSKYALPYMVAQLGGDNEHQQGMSKQLHATGNNLRYNSNTELFEFDRPQVDGGVNGTTSASVNMTVFSDLLRQIQVIDSALELIVNWETDDRQMFLEVVADDPATSHDIQVPFLSYETLNIEEQQPKVVYYKQWLSDSFLIPSTNNSTAVLRTQVLSTAFANKFVSKIMLVNVPLSVNTGVPEDSIKPLYNLMSSYMSVPMVQESFNIAIGGKNVYVFRGTSNDAIKMSMTTDCWGGNCLLSNSHFQAVEDLIGGLGATYNGFSSFGAAELNQRVLKQLQISYERAGSGEDGALDESMVLFCIGQIQTSLQNGIKTDL
jgi:hypothetical protein